MNEQIVFTNSNSGTLSYLHSWEQTSFKQCFAGSFNTACISGNKLFVSQSNKALINIYNLNGFAKKESVEQRLPLPELCNCIELVENTSSHLPYLLIASTPSGKLYIWELNSGNLLCVKNMAHYQSITKIKSIIQGKYIVTSGNDSRLIIWQTMDLISRSDPKPLFILHDHTLPITDFQVSNAHSNILQTKLFTVSQDMTLRSYSLDLNLEAPKILTTFTFPYELTSLELDPADRACYVGTVNGTFSLPFFYQLSSNKVVNILPGNTDSRIYSVVESRDGVDLDISKLFQMGQLVLNKLNNIHTSVIRCSMDGSLLTIGDNLGKCTVIDIFSKQPIKEILPINTQDNHGFVTNIIITSTIMNNGSLLSDNLSSEDMNKIPPLKKFIFDSKTSHEIQFQVKDHLSDFPAINPLEDFELYLDRMASQENIFIQSGTVSSTIKVVDDSTLSHTPTTVINHIDHSKDSEKLKLKDTIMQLTDAYKELREVHETLFEEHKKLLEKTNQTT